MCFFFFFFPKSLNKTEIISSVGSVYVPKIKLLPSLKVSDKNMELQNYFNLNCAISCRSRHIRVSVGLGFFPDKILFHGFLFLLFKQSQRIRNAVEQK